MCSGGSILLYSDPDLPGEANGVDRTNQIAWPLYKGPRVTQVFGKSEERTDQLELLGAGGGRGGFSCN
jgi:hypothetical protein